jgi:uncharacterized protein YecT (DUF1311 family)
MKFRCSKISPGQLSGIILTCIFALAASLVAEPGRAQSRKPTAEEVAAIHDCASKNMDNGESETQCLFRLVADRCIGDPGAATDRKLTDCYEIEASIWDELLNQNYKRLLETLDEEQAGKASAMQRAWIAYRDTTCHFYADKIRGTMANFMIAACVARETSRRAMLLGFFRQL